MSYVSSESCQTFRVLYNQNSPSYCNLQRIGADTYRLNISHIHESVDRINELSIPQLLDLQNKIKSCLNTFKKNQQSWIVRKSENEAKLNSSTGENRQQYKNYLSQDVLSIHAYQIGIDEDENMLRVIDHFLEKKSS